MPRTLWSAEPQEGLTSSHVQTVGDRKMEPDIIENDTLRCLEDPACTTAGIPGASRRARGRHGDQRKGTHPHLLGWEPGESWSPLEGCLEVGTQLLR